jgi:UDP-glucuronate 4-epimerase
MGKGAKCDVLSGKIVLVTGAAGFIGSATAAVLLERGDVVVGVDEMNTYYDKRIKQSNVNDLESNYDHFTMYVGDICDNELMLTIFAKHSITHVCHLAARAGVRPSIQDPFIYVHSNIEGTTRLLDLARQYNIANFVYASSSSVYGSSTAEVRTDSTLTQTCALETLVYSALPLTLYTFYSLLLFPSPLPTYTHHDNYTRAAHVVARTSASVLNVHRCSRRKMW